MKQNSKVTLRLSLELRARLRKVADDEGRSEGDVIRRVLVEWVTQLVARELMAKR